MLVFGCDLSHKKPLLTDHCPCLNRILLISCDVTIELMDYSSSWFQGTGETGYNESVIVAHCC